MVKKNKLYKHHKSKAFFYVRNFSFVFLGILGVGLSIGIPTYISSIQEQQISTEAKAQEKLEEDKQDTIEATEEEDLLSYN